MGAPWAAGGKGSAQCSTACTNGTPSSISEKVGKVSPVVQGENGAGKEGPGMFWGKGASSKANESKMEKCGGVSRPCEQILEDRERRRNAQDTHSIPISSGFVGREVNEVDGAPFRGHADGFQWCKFERGDSGRVGVKPAAELELLRMFNFVVYIIDYMLRDHPQGIS